MFSPEREARFTNPMPLPEREARFTDPMPLPEREARSTNHTNASAPGPSAPPAPAELELVKMGVAKNSFEVFFFFWRGQMMERH